MVQNLKGIRLEQNSGLRKGERPQTLSTMPYYNYSSLFNDVVPTTPITPRILHLFNGSVSSGEVIETRIRWGYIYNCTEGKDLEGRRHSPVEPKETHDEIGQDNTNNGLRSTLHVPTRSEKLRYLIPDSFNDVISATGVIINLASNNMRQCLRTYNQTIWCLESCLRYKGRF